VKQLQIGLLVLIILQVELLFSILLQFELLLFDALNNDNFFLMHIMHQKEVIQIVTERKESNLTCSSIKRRKSVSQRCN
jgi:hypothetical protein